MLGREDSNITAGCKCDGGRVGGFGMFLVVVVVLGRMR